MDKNEAIRFVRRKLRGAKISPLLAALVAEELADDMVLLFAKPKETKEIDVQLKLRMPPAMHDAVRSRARGCGQTINKFIQDCISRSINS